MDKRPIGIAVLGYLLIISGLLTISFEFILPAHAGFALLVSNLLSSIAILPRGLPWLLGYLPTSAIGILFKFALLWMVGIVLCGIGILLMKNIARKVFIGLSLIHIVIFLTYRLLSIHKPYTHYSSGGALIDALAKINYNFLVVLFPLIYIVYLMLPEVRRQFK
ncbi:MAG: hypothetical protein ABSB18_05385 [Candidatus Omnitrophota bacterium]